MKEKSRYKYDHIIETEAMTDNNREHISTGILQ